MPSLKSRNDHRSYSFIQRELRRTECDPVDVVEVYERHCLAIATDADPEISPLNSRPNIR